MNIKERVTQLRKLMSENGIDAYIIPSGDPHQSEYTAECWKSRKWISGFSGSAGTVVITADKGGLWTDSRYFLQAENELADSSIVLFKMGEPEVPNYSNWLKENLSKGAKIGFDGKVFSIASANSLAEELSVKDITIESQFDFIDEIWKERPSIPMNTFYSLDLKYAGKSRTEKIAEIRKEMVNLNADYHLITTLDDIAWIFNIRGKDVTYNPVVISYAVISADEVVLFVEEQKVTAELRTELYEDKITINPYYDIVKYLAEIKEKKSILISENKTNKWLYDSINPECRIIKDINISTKLKACKNETEIKNFKEAHIKDGVAMVKFLFWLHQTVGKEEVTELSATEKLEEFRKQGKNYMGPSFGTISGYKEHGAIVHYSSTPETDVKLQTESFLLLDSGGQYLEGTTDITRTIPLGNLTEEEKRDFTLVLKGHIDLAMAKFPTGTRGIALDILARKAMWDAGINYGHGTGHGVGFFLNVHEGPQSISQGLAPAALEVGMVTSNEPGIYRENKHGIRIESIIVVNKDEETQFGKFLKFETITLCPIDTDAVIPEMLTKAEKKWLNDYHKNVFKQLAPFLTGAENNWLRYKTKEI